ncbi:MAG: fructose-6-phosphate aldolase [Dehalococcoidales bacterium]|nr:MAG: fructose-6-phosphate aldolase [Dehalococcoidales bacterium]
MRIFLDTAKIEEVRQASRLGVISGVTTNPTLMARAGATDYEATIKEIASIIPGPISTEVVVEGVESMLKQAREMAAWAPNIVIKIPVNADGLEVTSILAKENIKVNMTLCFSANQALLAALSGAAYISPFVGRLDDIGQDGMQLVEEILYIYENYPDINTEVIAASIRHPEHCLRAAGAGAHIATIPYDVLIKMIQHPMTDTGISRFLEDWKNTPK